MRLKLQSGKLKEFIYRLKGSNSWKELSTLLGIKEYLLKSWAKECSLIDENVFYSLDLSYQYEKYILEKKPTNWGQIKGGKNSPGTTKTIRFPPKDERLAELVGIILGDGNIQVSKGKKSTSYMLRIVGDSNKDREYLINYVKPLCDSLFNLDSKIRKHKTANELFVILNSKKVVDFLISLGLKSGDKIKNNVGIPHWVYEDNVLLKKCIRGLVDTDGSVYELIPHWPGIFQLCFTNKDTRLMNDFVGGLKQLGLSCSRIYSGKNTPKVYLTKKSELRKFYKEIGFSNIKHRNKIAPWCSGLIHS